jgi:hypothetical protein
MNGSTLCERCPPGHECSNPAILPQSCPSGYFSSNEASTSCTVVNTMLYVHVYVCLLSYNSLTNTFLIIV